MSLQGQLRLGRVVQASPLLPITGISASAWEGPDLMDRITQGIVMRMDRNRIGGSVRSRCRASERAPIN
jgi:hypothetical protein